MNGSTFSKSLLYFSRSILFNYNNIEPGKLTCNCQFITPVWCTYHSLQICNCFPPRPGWRKYILDVNRDVLRCECPYCAVSICVDKVRQNWGHCISDFSSKCCIKIRPIINHHTFMSILTLQGIIWYCVMSVLMKNSRLLLWINLLN